MWPKVASIGRAAQASVEVREAFVSRVRQMREKRASYAESCANQHILCISAYPHPTKCCAFAAGDFREANVHIEDVTFSHI
jgi:hypothetical protein